MWFLIFEDAEVLATLAPNNWEDSRRIYYIENIKSNGLEFAAFNFSVMPAEFIWDQPTHEALINQQFSEVITA